MPSPAELRRIRVLSMDVTGTLIRHLDPIASTYSQAMHWAGFPRPIPADELAPAFKRAYKKVLLEHPCFGSGANLSSRQWWRRCVGECLREAGREEGRDFEAAHFDRWFRRVYQHYGCPQGYVPMEDALPFLRWATFRGYLLGVTTNTPSRTMDSVMPFMGLHQYFRFFVCSQDVGEEKPAEKIFKRAEQEIEHFRQMLAARDAPVDHVLPWNEQRPQENHYRRMFGANGELKAKPVSADEILHIGDNLPADLCGPRAVGWHAMHLDRSGDPNVRVYQDWLVGPDYPNKSEEDIRANTVYSFDEVRRKLEAAAAAS